MIEPIRCRFFSLSLASGGIVRRAWVFSDRFSAYLPILSVDCFSRLKPTKDRWRVDDGDGSQSKPTFQKGVSNRLHKPSATSRISTPGGNSFFIWDTFHLTGHEAGVTAIFLPATPSLGSSRSTSSHGAKSACRECQACRHEVRKRCATLFQTMVRPSR